MSKPIFHEVATEEQRQMALKCFAGIKWGPCIVHYIIPDAYMEALLSPEPDHILEVTDDPTLQR